MSNKLVWITGASTGIGYSLALQYAEHGHTVVASARSVDKLASLVAAAEALTGTIVAVAVDVTSEESVTAAVDQMQQQFNRQPDVAILNAGYYEPLELEQVTLEHFERTYDVNLRGVVRCLIPMLTAFRARSQGGQVVLVSSIAGYSGLPRAAAYGSSKAALIHMAESLKHECESHNITITVVNPGFVKTPLTDLNTFSMPFMLEPEDAAKRMFSGIEAKKFEVTFPRRFTWWFKLMRILPYPLYFLLTKKLL